MHTSYLRLIVEWAGHSICNPRQQIYMLHHAHKQAGSPDHWSVLEHVVGQEAHFVQAAALEEALNSGTKLARSQWAHKSHE